MAAPTNTFSSGSGTITTTGEGNGLLLTVDPGLRNPRVDFGFAGTFTSCVVAIRGRRIGLASYYPVKAVQPNGGAVISDCTSISLTDSTNAVIAVDATGCDYLEVWVVSGTPTTFTVEARQSAAGGSLVNVLNTTVSGTQTYTGASTVNVSSATAFVVGPNGTTNPTLKVVTNTASAATGLSVTAAAAAGGLAVAVLSSGTDESLTLNAKGAGLTNIAGVSTGLVVLGRGVLKTPVLGLTKTDINTQNAAPTIAQLLGGYVTHNSQTGAGTLTTPTGALISGGISGVATGDSFLVMYQNRGNQTVTLTAGDGNVTLKGTVAIPTLKTTWLLFNCTGANTWDVCQVLSA